MAGFGMCVVERIATPLALVAMDGEDCRWFQFEVEGNLLSRSSASSS